MAEYHSKIYHGRVYHKRFQPTEHRLDYGVCSFLFDLDELGKLDKEVKFFSHNKFNLLSFHDKDYGSGAPEPLRNHVEKLLEDAGIDIEKGKIFLLCYPRILGYVFNPLSVYYCYHGDGTLKAVLYEVSNTFDERHTYLMAVEPHPSGLLKQQCQKVFYVSPFMDVSGHYEFTLLEPGEKISIVIDYFDQDRLMLKASFSGRQDPLKRDSVLKVLRAYPLMTVKVIAGIHWEALKLWRKGVGLFKHPEPPQEPVSTGTFKKLEAES